MRTLRALVIKDLKLFRSDRRSLIVVVVMPMLLSLLFGFIFRSQKEGGASLHLRSRVVDLDRSPGAERLALALARNPILTARPATRAEAEKLLQDSDIDVAFIIPAGFVAAAASARVAGHASRPEITVVSDPSSRSAAGIAEGILQRTVAATLGPDLGADFARCADQQPPYATRQASISGGDAAYDGAAHALAGMGVQFIMIGGLDGAVMMLTERQRGLFRRLKAAPISRWLVIGSRLLSGAIIGFAVVLLLYAFGSMTMHVGIKGSRAGFVLVAAGFALMSSALGLLISSFGRTPQATRGAGIVVILVATMLSGAWLPAFLFPTWLQRATLFVPSRWAVDGLDAMSWRGLGLQAALAPAGVLALSALVFAALAAARFRWEE
ncbi:MAG TPA: ABC transporter permease [Kofleriaceae bacterium]|nr:ABC transporter permease [Kofleriaceae bacterium]